MGKCGSATSVLAAIAVVILLPGCTGRRPVIERTPYPYSDVSPILQMETQMDCSAASRIYKAAADQGDVRALVNLGGLSGCVRGPFVHGEGDAAAIYAQAAEKGDPLGQTNLGVLCITFVPGWLNSCRTYAEAAKWFTKAADQGYMPAVVYLGYMHERGLGVFPVDRQEAAALYRKASANGEKLGDVFLWDMENLETRQPRPPAKEPGK